MPLIAAAFSAYAVGLLLGFGGEFVFGASVTATVLVIGLVRGTSSTIATGALLAAGMLSATAHVGTEDTCRRQAVRLRQWTVTLDGTASPGAFVRGRARADRCELPVSVAVQRGTAPAGARATARGSAVLSRRGLVIQRASIHAAAPVTSLASIRAAIGRSIDRAFRDDAPLARALLVADTRTLDPALRDRFAAAGIIHMLSISGLHVVHNT